MGKNIEVEVRGPLSKNKYEDLIVLFETEGRILGDQERVLIDYSTFLEGEVENRKKDIRLRATNGIPEIIVKIGGWGGVEHRKELSVIARQGDFDTLVEIFAALGFQKGMLCIRKTRAYEYRGVRFALVEVPGHSYYYEAEKMACEDDDLDRIREDIERVCIDCGLALFDKTQFFEYVNRLNREANKVFDYARHAPGYFKNTFGI